MFRRITADLQLLLKISRPHFWLYEAGTFALGVFVALRFAAATPLDLIIWGFYFLIPANILIYGVNDVFDYETDLQNPKKQSYESVLAKDKHKLVLAAAVLSSLPFLFYALTLPLPALIALGAFLFFAFFYSSPPIRAKARPFFDSIFSAGHYVATGVFGFVLVAPDIAVSPLLIVAAMAWAIAMHVYSAIPDIEADRAAGLSTTATVLEHKLSLWYCAILYITAAGLAAAATQYLTLVLLLPYLAIMYLSYDRTEADLLRLYRVFPYLNATVGAVLSIQAIYLALL